MFSVEYFRRLVLLLLVVFYFWIIFKSLLSLSEVSGRAIVLFLSLLKLCLFLFSIMMTLFFVFLLFFFSLSLSELFYDVDSSYNWSPFTDWHTHRSMSSSSPACYLFWPLSSFGTFEQLFFFVAASTAVQF